MRGTVRFSARWVVAAATLLAARAQQEIQVGYTVVTAAPGEAVPVATALFSYRNSAGVLVSEAAVGAAEPLASGRIFVDEAGTLTSLALANTSPRSASVTLVLRDSSGREIDRRSLPLGAGEHLARYVAEIFPSMPASFAGSLRFDASERVAAVTLRQSLNPAGEPLYATLPVVDAGVPPSTASLIFPQIAAGAGYSTQLILVNSSPQRISGWLRFTDDAGRPLVVRSGAVEAAEIPYAIEPDGTYRAALDGGASLAVGYATAVPDAGSPAPAGTAVFRYLRDGAVVTEAGVAAAPSTTAARIFVDNVGTYTGVALANASDAPAAVTFELRDRYGDPIASVGRTLPARGHVAVFAHELFPDALTPSFTGLLEISSSVPFAPVTLKLTTNARGDAVLTTLPVADLTRPPSAGVIVFPQVAFGGGFATRLVFVNASSSAASGTLAFHRSSGAPMPVPLGGRTGSSFPYTLAGSAGRQLRPGDTALLASILLPSEVTINEGRSLRPEVRVVDTSGGDRDDFDLEFSSLSPDVAEVDPTGAIRGRRAGFSTLTVASAGRVATATITVVAVDSGSAGFAVTGLAQDRAGRLYLADASRHTILLAQGLKQPASVYAGSAGEAGFKNDLRLESRFRGPAFVALQQAQGMLYVSDAANNAVRSVQPGPEGRVATAASGLDDPQGLALDTRGFLWIADSGSHTVRRLDLATGAVAIVAGRAGSVGWADGRGDAARFSRPTGLALETEPLAAQIDRERRGLPPPPLGVIVADTGNGVLRRVRENGVVETVGALSVAAPAGAARVPALAAPVGVAVDPFGNIYVTEPDHGRVSVLLATGELVAAVQPGTFSSPRGVAVAQGGRVVVAEQTRTAAEIVYGEPRIDSVTPRSFGNRGGVRLTVKGKNFAPETVVVAGGALIDRPDVVDTETIAFTAPELPSGSATLTVQNRGGIAQTSIVIEPASLAALPRGFITTVAGGSSFAGEGSRATFVPVGPEGVAVDGAGNLFIADAANHRVRRVDARTGTMTTVAGNGQFVSGSSLDDVPATASPLVSPTGVAFDRSGNLLIVDGGEYRIRRVDARTGRISTVVKGDYGFCGDGGSALEACFNYLYAAAADRDGNLYLADAFNHRIRKVDAATGIITTFAGNGQDAYSGDGGPATAAALDQPFGIAIDDERRALYIADSGNDRVRRVDLAAGTISTVAGGGQPADGLGDGQRGTAARLGYPSGVALDAAGNLFIADGGNNRVRRVDVATGVITTVAGDTGGGGTGSLPVREPLGIALDSAGNVYVSELSGHLVLKVDGRTGAVSAAAGDGTRRPLADGSPATAAALLGPRGVAFDAAGNLFVTDTGNNRIRRVDAATGVIGTAAGGGSPADIGDDGPATGAVLSDPNGPVAFDHDGNFYIADTYNYRVRKVDARTGKISTVAGTGPGESSGDGGPATSAVMLPTSVALDGRGNLYVADEEAHTVRRIDAASGIITTVAGGGRPATGIGDGGHARDAILGSSFRIAADPAGNLFIADSEHERVRKVDAATQVITTMAGGGRDPGDGVPATSVFLMPVGLSLDPAGNLFVTDFGYPVSVRRVSATTGIITTVAGGTTTALGDSGPATAAFLYYPRTVAIDVSGNLFIADTDNDRVRAVKGPISP